MKRIVMFLIAMAFLTSAVLAADIGCNLAAEDFEGAFPPSGWQVTVYNDYGSTYGRWERTLGSSYSSSQAGFSGYAAGSIYGDYLLNTNLTTPSFSTVGVSEAKIEFSGYFYFYNGYGNKCDLQYSADGGLTWTTFNTWDTYGSPTEESIALPAGALGQPNVMLRWQRYASSYPYYYALVDNVQIVCETDAKPVPVMPLLMTMVLGAALAGIGIYGYKKHGR